MIDNKIYKVVGLMSGTSLDGIDLAYCHFKINKKKWSFKLVSYKYIDYSIDWKFKLSNLFYNEKKIDLIENDYSLFISKEINKFITEKNLDVDYISSHGHTIFHQPEKCYTKQIGRGDIIARETKKIVICNFREKDILLGGQGAPLVPFGDSLLFSEYDSCLNLGGFSNISYKVNNKVYAYDVCPLNIVFNDLSKRIGFDFDENGLNASKGTLNSDLLNDLNKISYYHLNSPKSLSKEWVENVFNPILDNYKISVYDLLRTCTEHFSSQIITALKKNNISSCLISGGGSFNKFFIQNLKSHSSFDLVIPKKEIILFKEAIIFAFLGLQRFYSKINCFSTVTGASKDHSCGDIYFPQ